MNQAQGADHRRVGKLLVELCDLRGQQQTLVNDGARGERGNVEEALVVQAGGGDLGFGALADHVQLALQRVLVHPQRVLDEDLLDVGLGDARDAADGIHVDWRIAPAEHAQSLLADDALDDPFAGQALVALHGEKHHAHAILARVGKGDADAGALAGEELVRDLDEQAGAIARFRIAAAGATVQQVQQDLNALEDDVVGLLALDVDHKPDPAGVALERRIVQALRLRVTAG